jgi:hypothetical protein
MDDQERREQIEKLLFGRQNPEKLERQWFVFPAISRWLILRRPEIALFPNEAEQAKAVHALEREPGRVLHWILGWMISLFVMASAFLVMVRLLRPPEWVRMGALGPMILMGGSAYFVYWNVAFLFVFNVDIASVVSFPRIVRNADGGLRNIW